MNFTVRDNRIKFTPWYNRTKMCKDGLLYYGKKREDLDSHLQMDARTLLLNP
jgi:hypothetical protein